MQPFFVASLAWNLGLGMTWLAVPLYAHSQGLSNAEIGALFAAPVLAQALLNLAGGAYTDRIGGRRIMLGACWATVVAGVWFISAAMMGYSSRPLAPLERLVYCVTGILTFMPANVLGAGRWFNVAGVALAIALFLHARLRKPPAALETQ